ncbi:MAG: dihydrolipoyl dehydrogenase [Bacteroidetes bacterium SW_11_45_7]|nr:MAG: dihydrolipoyl dehydrogenase [Bacteroidetes bacterium SW_11_45_7]
MNYDLIIIGSGPGGYVAAIRASRLGMKVAVVERAELGGVCLNWGCIPTKALLKSAEVFNYIKEADQYGIQIQDPKVDFTGMVKRSREVADGMSKGIQFLFKKNKIDHIQGDGKVTKNKKVAVRDENGKAQEYEAKNIILAPGARSREISNLKQDGNKIIGYREAMTLDQQPEKIVIVGAGAIGSEFAHFYNSIGTEVVLVEYQDRIVPVEDADVSKELARSFKKKKMKVMTGSSVDSVDTSGKKCKVKINTSKGEETEDADIVLSAVGYTPNTENIGLEELGLQPTKSGAIEVDEYYRTGVDHVFAIGDAIPGPALAHVGSAEGITCVEHIAGEHPAPLDYNNLPACTYCQPEIASVGYSEAEAKEQGYEVKVGKFPFTASGKASAAGKKEGFVKVVFDAKYGEWLGAHMIGANVTEMIAEAVSARKLETTGHEIIKSVHPHPTMSEAVMEAVAAAYDEVIHV